MPGPSRDLVERLYGTPPDRFVAARDAAVAESRRAGDPATAREIAKLRRPTVAAWLVNLLAIRRPELVAGLVELAEALRSAQRDLRGPKLRELSAQRRAVVAALVAEARTLAAGTEGAPPAGRLPLAEVEATLNAALADTEVAAEVRAGRLLRAASYAGFGEVPRPQLRLLTGGAGEPLRAGSPPGVRLKAGGRGGAAGPLKPARPAGPLKPAEPTGRPGPERPTGRRPSGRPGRPSGRNGPNGRNGGGRWNGNWSGHAPTRNGPRRSWAARRRPNATPPTHWPRPRPSWPRWNAGGPSPSRR
ncbi:hypothetical protein [Micromonospora echinospora]|uniref:hypothetical protein n=1 Tax=Micromonospora echinospora TaxID=1877 RepID=UPI003A838E0F